MNTTADIEGTKLMMHRSAAELEKEPEDMTDDEKERLVRIREIPSIVKMILQSEAERIREEVIGLEKRRDAIIDYLNGERK